MDKSNNHSRFLELRKAYPYFVFQRYSIFRTKTSLKFRFHFDMAGKFVFEPEIEIPARSFYNLAEIPDETLENLVFHIGLVELISYWKAACPPRVIIRAGYLNREQTEWWKKLYFNGLGEFFYLNGIETDREQFMEMVPEGKPMDVARMRLEENRVLVPVGGGKDSVVTLELLKKTDFKVRPFLLNPREASLRTIDIAGFSDDESVVVHRTLDAKLLELNKAGFLNGHTPFSALLAFVSALTALLSGSRYIALSNESSANESTVPGSTVNHQYSKSFEFEQDFNAYLEKYIHPGLHYFSFLRPLNELQIAALFSQFPQHHFSFRSCNVGSKTDSWCGQCPKCLFTYTVLSPFLPQPKLEKIFGKNLLKEKSLEKILQELDGRAAVKPFECVGTPDEVNAALRRTFDFQTEENNLPLLQHVAGPDARNYQQVFGRLLHQVNHENFLNEEFMRIILKALENVTV